MTTAAAHPSERAAVEIGLIAAAFGAAVVLIVGVAWAALHPAPSRLALVTRCLEHEKQLDVFSPIGDPVADSATAGAVTTAIGGNRVTIVLGASQAEASQLLQAYRSRGIPRARLTEHGALVAMWAGAPAVGQLQTLFDCAY